MIESTILWVGMGAGFLLGTAVSFGALAIRIWWLNRGREGLVGQWRMFGG